MELKIWLVYLFTDFLLNIIPGPAVILVSSQALTHGFKNSCIGTLGLISGEGVYFILSALGLGSLILATSHLFNILKFVGAIYLIFTGIVMIYNTFKNSSQILSKSSTDIKSSKLYLQGFITMISNPKAIIFFVALLPQFIKPERNIVLQFFVLGITTIISDGIVLLIYGWIADRGKKLMNQNTIYTKIKERISGLVLVGIGVNLLFLKLRK